MHEYGDRAERSPDGRRSSGSSWLPGRRLRPQLDRSTPPTRWRRTAGSASRGADRLDRRPRRVLRAQSTTRRSSRRHATTRCSPRRAATTAAPVSTTSSRRRPSGCTSPSSSTCPSTGPTARCSTRSPRRPRSPSVQPMIERWTTWFVDQVIEGGECDLADRHRRARGRHARLARTRRRRLAALLAGPALGARRLAGQPGPHARRRGGHPVDGGADHRGDRRPPSASRATT